MVEIYKYKHIIWDWNGTIFNDVDYSRRIINRILKDRNIPEITIEKYRSVFTYPLKKYYEKLKLDISDNKWKLIDEEFTKTYEERKLFCELYFRAREVLNIISQIDKTQFLISTVSQTTLEKMVIHFHLTEYFEEIYGIENKNYIECKLANANKLLCDLNCKKGEVLYIGDTLHDWDVACKLGVDLLLIADGHQNIHLLQQTGSKVINSLDQFYHYLILYQNIINKYENHYEK